MKRFVFIAISAALLQFSQIASSQPYGGGRYQGSMPMDAKITGTIIDESNNQAVPYASVAIYKQKDSTLINGVMSNADGSFTLDKLPYGKFYIEINFVGYKKHRVHDILLVPSKKLANLGAIKISPTSTSIKEVDVLGSSSPVEYRIDKKVVDVSQNIAAAGGTVVDALQNTPSIQTDEQGNVTLRGSSNFTVLIDGKPSPIDGSEALQQIPANLVQNVEIITNPGAKYDAEGSAGIINVVMKKQKIRGANAFVNLTAGTGDKYSGNINLNYKHDKFNFSLGADYTNMKFSATFFKNSNYNLLDTLKNPIGTENETANGNGSFKREGQDITGGIDYNINDHNVLSVSGRIGYHTFTRAFNSTYTDQFQYEDTTKAPIYYLNSSTGEYKRNFYNLNFNYDLKLNDKGHELTASAYLAQGPEDNLSDLYTDTTNASWGTLGKTKINNQAPQNSDQTDFRSKLDYTLPLGDNSKLEAGYQGRYYEDLGNQGLYNYDYATNSFVEDITQRDKFNFKDNIQAGYLSFSNSNKIVNLMLGLRAENEDRKFIQKISGQTNIVNELKFFPSLHFSKQMPWGLQMQASYHRSIDRPHDWNLDPMAIHTSPLSIREGNASLRPQLTGSYELNLEKQFTQSSFASIEGFYRETSDLIQQTQNQDAITRIDTITFSNLDHDRSIGVDFTLNLALAKWFNFYASSSIYNYRLFGKVEPGVATNTNTWDLRINPSFSIPHGPGIQLSYSYNAPTISSQGTREGHYANSIGIKQDLFKHKGSLTLTARDLIGSEKYASTIVIPNSTTYQYFQRESRVFMLTFSYRINNYKAQQAKRNPDDVNGAPDQGTDMGGF